MDQRTILLVSGDSETGAVFRTILAHQDYRVLEAGDGAEGLRLARENRPDLLITDALPPFADGLTLPGKLKSDPATASIPILMVTPAGPRRELPTDAACDVYLAKPIWPLRVAETVERLIGPSVAA